MEQEWLKKQKELYQNQNLPNQNPSLSVHPISGIWQESDYMKSQFWWGGGACQESWQQIQDANSQELTQIAVLTFGPVQSFLGGGQRLRDWAVASWLCHYLSAVIIHNWKKLKGKVLLPLHESSELVKWLDDDTYYPNERKFWQAELPNVITGLHPNQKNWLEDCEQMFYEEWQKFLNCLEAVVVEKYPHFLNGQGWKVIHHDASYMWSVYKKSKPLNFETVTEDIEDLYQYIESEKIGRRWTGTWWGGRTSPSDGCLSIWHPGLKLISQKGTWGIPSEEIENWWETATTTVENQLSGLFSSSDRLNSIELIKRLASVPDIIEETLRLRWDKENVPRCPWGTFPDRSSVAASWVTSYNPQVASIWNQKLASLDKTYFSNFASFYPSMVKWIVSYANKRIGELLPDINSWDSEQLKLFFVAYKLLLNKTKKTKWGMPLVDKQAQFHHPRVLERRNIGKSLIDRWDKESPKGWESTIEWTVGWRGDGDNMGKWLSGEQYEDIEANWLKWHLDLEKITKYNLGISPPVNNNNSKRQIELPHILDLSVLFGLWNQLLYTFTEDYHHGKVIFAGGDDFLLLAPLTEAVSLTCDLHQLWTGERAVEISPDIQRFWQKEMPPLIQPLPNAKDGWVRYGKKDGTEKIYPIPGKDINFSLGVVIAQRRIPQSLWHRGLNEAYKKAKDEGKNRVCVRVLFNSGQSLDWVCPWPLWNLLMPLEPNIEIKTKLNCWEKLLFYFESTRLRQKDISAVKPLLETLWLSVGLDLNWTKIENVNQYLYDREIQDWQWWIDWISLKTFLARQERDRIKWLEKMGVVQK
ncbi:type III-B CRISPR-associated protein Cas10/Cmr2 [Floridanema evergladense]|uniref:Type III-B CRISPR-associated protein Cas10/Cmr2 n=1 Tax=Floridaenema evergladense BLCC-F167 TaxID=3153639 RepID=A0ABV4WD45_9CYAN